MHFHPDRGFHHPTPSEITPRPAYEARRDWLKALAIGATGTALGSWAIGARIFWMSSTLPMTFLRRSR